MYYLNSNEKGVLNVIGPRLRKVRCDKKISQTRLSELCRERHLRRSVATISKIENQLRSVYDYEVQIFADALGVSVTDLFDRSEDELQAIVVCAGKTYTATTKEELKKIVDAL